MNSKLTALLSTALMTGLLASHQALAEEAASTAKTGDQMSADKNSCKGHASDDKNSCKSSKAKKKKASDKNSCKNGCGEATEKKD